MEFTPEQLAAITLITNYLVQTLKSALPHINPKLIVIALATISGGLYINLNENISLDQIILLMGSIMGSEISYKVYNSLSQEKTYEPKVSTSLTQ